MEMKLCQILVFSNGLKDKERNVKTWKLMHAVGGCLSPWSRVLFSS